MAHIRSEIRQPDAGRRPADPLFDCRLFLGMAEAFDRQSAEAALGLEDLTRAESRMLGELRGEGISPAGLRVRALPEDDALGYMLPRRMRAWAGLYLSAPPDRGVFITLAAEVIDHLAEFCGPDGLLRIGTVSAPASRSDFLQQLESMADSGAAEKMAPAAAREETGSPDASPPRIKLYLAPGRRAEEFFAPFSPAGIRPRSAAQPFPHTLIGLLAR